MARAYANTVFYSFTGTAMALIVMSLFAYVLSLKDFKARNKFAFYAFFTTMFSAGLVPAYFVNVRLLHLGDTIWIFLLPGLVAPFNVIILRTFMQTSIPDSLMEAARLDGASDWRIYWQIVMPLSKAGLATVGLTTLVAKWNDWFTGLLYVRNPDLIPLMTYLEKMQKNLDFLKANSQLAGTPDGKALLASIPTQSTRMAISSLISVSFLFQLAALRFAQCIRNIKKTVILFDTVIAVRCFMRKCRFLNSTAIPDASSSLSTPSISFITRN